MDVRRGRIWKFGDDISTDLIQPNVRAAPEDRPRYCFSVNRPGWSSQTAPGDMVVAGRNFGTGSSRPAAGNFRALGIACILAESINGLFMRNSMNLGLPALAVPGVWAAFEEPDTAEVDLEIGYVRNARTDRLVRFSPLPRMLLDLLDQGGIMAVLVKNGYVDAPRSNPTP